MGEGSAESSPVFQRDCRGKSQTHKDAWCLCPRLYQQECFRCVQPDKHISISSLVTSSSHILSFHPWNTLQYCNKQYDARICLKVRGKKGVIFWGPPFFFFSRKQNLAGKSILEKKLQKSILVGNQVFCHILWGKKKDDKKSLRIKFKSLKKSYFC